MRKPVCPALVLMLMSGCPWTPRQGYRSDLEGTENWLPSARRVLGRKLPGACSRWLLTQRFWSCKSSAWGAAAG